MTEDKLQWKLTPEAEWEQALIGSNQIATMTLHHFRTLVQGGMLREEALTMTRDFINSILFQIKTSNVAKS